MSTTTHERRGVADLLARGQARAPLRTAVVYPVDRPALLSAVEAWQAGAIDPLLVGPAAAVRGVAAAARVDLTGVEVLDAPSEEDAARLATQLAAAGEAAAIMKGDLHTSTLLRAVLSPGSGLRRSAWVSHVFVFDVPSYPKPLLLSDAAVSVAPDLEQKAVICRHAITVAHVLGIPVPKVAVLSANEQIDPAIPSSVEAAALAKMGQRGQIAGAVIDGPLAMDNAISAGAADVKHLDSPVAGDADVLIVPNLEAGNILYKSLTYLAAADTAGVVLGAAVPIILVSRADSVRTRVASAALAAELAAAG